VMIPARGRKGQFQNVPGASGVPIKWEGGGKRRHHLGMIGQDLLEPVGQRVDKKEKPRGDVRTSRKKHRPGPKKQV